MRLQVLELIVTIKNPFMKIIVTILFFCVTLLLPAEIWAINDPLSVDNNKYGIHIIDENDLENAAFLVNSSGGDWGYVTIVIREDDRNNEKWQKIFDRMRQLHLIPLVRLATRMENAFWKKPKLEDVSSWTDFLSSLHWVTKNRYVIIFNEPNHAKEWGGSLAPVEYAQIISSFSATLKARSDDFFILPAGLDASAPNSSITMDERAFLNEMHAFDTDVFSYIDGWTSHSYPNPGFTGKVTAAGRGTLFTYKWEINLLKNLGVNKTLPIFITETGWPHQEGPYINYNYLQAENVADYLEDASKTVWNDKNITAITPFVLNYESFPFANFSWQMPASQNFYPQFDSYRSLPKIAGKPELTYTITPAPTVVHSVLGANIRSSSPSIFQLALNLIVYLQHLVYNRR